jgi:hypothetical protein
LFPSDSSFFLLFFFFNFFFHFQLFLCSGWRERSEVVKETWQFPPWLVTHVILLFHTLSSVLKDFLTRYYSLFFLLNFYFSLFLFFCWLFFSYKIQLSSLNYTWELTTQSLTLHNSSFKTRLFFDAILHKTIYHFYFIYSR